MSTTFIYALRDPRDDRIRYVGKANDPKERLRYHLGRPGGSRAKMDWLADLKTHGFSPDIILLQEVERSEWEAVEKSWIAELRARDPDALTNVLSGGGITDHSAETRAKIAASQVGRKHTAESRAKIAASRLGIKLSAEQRKNFGVKQRGRKASAEVRRHMSEAHKARTIVVTEETRRKIGKAHRGKIMSAETRAKLSAANIGKKSSPEANAKRAETIRNRVLTLEQHLRLSTASMGRRHTPESKAKISRANTGRPRPDLAEMNRARTRKAAQS